MRRAITLALVVVGSTCCALDWRGAWPDARRDLPGADVGRADRAHGDGPTPSDFRSDGILAPAWIVIPAGTFVMGSPPSEGCRELDPDGGKLPLRETQHLVQLTHGFEIMASEVTRDVFRQQMGYTPHDSKCWRCPEGLVSWHEAVALCNALSVRDKLESCYTNKGSNKSCLGAGGCSTGELCIGGICAAYNQSSKDIYHCPGYRLPTEAEWEYAYRAGSTTAYHDGSATGACADCDTPNPADSLGWYHCNANVVNPVMKKPPNGWGLYDMAGNLWEWCHDSPADDLGSQPQVDPQASAAQTHTLRVLRGGGYSSYAGTLRAAQRYSGSPELQWSDVGFRCVRTRFDLTPDGGLGPLDAGR